MLTPVDTLASLSPSHRSSPHLCSLYNNKIGDKGASALATILKETKITNLKCAAARAFAFVSMPADKKANTLWQPIISLTSPAPVSQRRLQ